jgi:hypothetical protein
VRLRLDHPVVAAIACEDCKKWVYDMKTGKVQTYQCGSPDNVKPTPRPGPPPCEIGWKCPKGSPERERLCQLTLRNMRMWDTFLEKRANRLPTLDALQVGIFTKLEILLSARERQQVAENLSVMIAALVLR